MLRESIQEAGLSSFQIVITSNSMNLIHPNYDQNKEVIDENLSGC